MKKTLMPTFSYALLKSSILGMISLAIFTCGLIYTDFALYLFSVSAIPLLLFTYNVFLITSYEYAITDEQIIFTRGVFSKKTSPMELYRVKDLEESRPLHLRLIGAMTIELDTSDKSHPKFKMEGIPKSVLLDELRRLVETNRRARGVREFD